jgi:hypothetical protein
MADFHSQTIFATFPSGVIPTSKIPTSKIATTLLINASLPVGAHRNVILPNLNCLV